MTFVDTDRVNFLLYLLDQNAVKIFDLEEERRKLLAHLEKVKQEGGQHGANVSR